MTLAVDWDVKPQYKKHTILSQKRISKGNNSKQYFQELWFLHSACHPMLVNISMQFHEDEVKEWTKFCHRNIGVILVWHKILIRREHPDLSSGFEDLNRPRILGIHDSVWILELPM